MLPCVCVVFDCGHAHHTRCYCNEDQGSGYTYSDEYGGCVFCSGLFKIGQVVGANRHNEPVLCKRERGTY